MTFRSNKRPLFTEIFGPIIGLKEEWEELDFSAFTYRCEQRALIPVNTGFHGGHSEQLIEETEEHRICRGHS
jgi:hypothetical protein